MVTGRLTSTKKQLRKLIVGAVAATVVMALVGHAAAAEAMQADINGPFGLPTVAISEGQWSATWRDLQSQIQSEKRIIAQCRAEPHLCTSSAALRFISLVKEGEQYDSLLRIARINRAVNFAISAASQPTWTSPLNVLAAGVGDCKQYAVLKYAVLEAAGFAPEDLRLVIVRIKSQPNNHAVVAVRHGSRWFVLDNRSLAVVQSKELLDYYVPLLTPDHQGVRQFVVPPNPKVAGLQ
jgi:predicted transglutaminase-like cysteine proteinase